MTTPPAIPPIDPQTLVDYLGRTRWFGGKGRPFAVSAVRRIGAVPGTVEGGPTVLLQLVEVTYSDVPGDAADRVEHYQVPLACYAQAQTRLDHAFLGWWEEPELGWVHAYDALHDREAMACWQRTLHAAATAPEGVLVDADSGLTFHRLPGHDLDLQARATLFSGEQSNSSVAYGEDALMKVFRKVTPGANPDIAIHDVLTRANSDDVASLYGWVEWVDSEAEGGGEVWDLAMLQQFLRTASDGWELALASVRTLFSDPETHAAQSGGDFAGEATRLGLTLRGIHALLAEHVGTGTTPSRELAGLMAARLTPAVAAASDLAPYEAGLTALFGRVAALGELPVQRVHGDLHLGQTLRTSLGWKIVDFEGEPARPLADRVLPDSPWRDVAGMLRSFDYASRVVERSWADDPEGSEVRAHQAQEWANRAKNHFLVAYSDGAMSETDKVLLDAYVADKAVYETVYETRNRPTWVDIPLQAVAEIGAP
ncbi:maltokinase N-terminal cap-like domain-containing protein [Nocardioides acrostichi]|uniref:Maltokinase n=1 Tax=Nocardioides acrostichi TaxID=2784339 RepID=A0A930UW43_9ACTN|nr:hypothetical protein [Nocardioides acrostichi]MBF4161953.1 hypothetical protein [Nocardioides acrostichi]